MTRDAKGNVYTVRYEAVNAMLLNEFIKEHRKVEEQETTLIQLKANLAKQEAIIAKQQRDSSQRSLIAARLQAIKDRRVAVCDRAQAFFFSRLRHSALRE